MLSSSVVFVGLCGTEMLRNSKTKTAAALPTKPLATQSQLLLHGRLQHSTDTQSNCHVACGETESTPRLEDSTASRFSLQHRSVATIDLSTRCGVLLQLIEPVACAFKQSCSLYLSPISLIASVVQTQRFQHGGGASNHLAAGARSSLSTIKMCANDVFVSARLERKCK